MQDQHLDDWERRFAAYLGSRPGQTDGSHDLGHFQRVAKAARAINREEGNPADPLTLLASAYFHDLISLPKDHPQRSESSRLSAEGAVELLQTMGFPPEKIEGVRHAIHAHSFSAGVAPLTVEAKILQDADRMEALGAIGLARVFYTAGQMDSKLWDPGDPMAENREPDDRRFALDHFKVKLLKLPALMNTAAGRRRAEGNAAYLLQFLEKIHGEIRGDYSGEPFPFNS
jgi:uncharacterized protein